MDIFVAVPSIAADRAALVRPLERLGHPFGARNLNADRMVLVFPARRTAATTFTGNNLDMALGADLSAIAGAAPEIADAIGSNEAASAPPNEGNAIP